MRPAARTALALLLLCPPIFARADGSLEVERLRIRFANAGSVFVIHPKAWQPQVLQPKPSFPASVLFKHGSGREAVSMNVTFFPEGSDEFDRLFAGGAPYDLEFAARKFVRKFVASSVQGKAHLKSARGETARVVYAEFTDRAYAGPNASQLPAGEFRNMTAGVVSSGNIAAIFTLLSNDLSALHHKMALSTLSEGVYVPAHAAAHEQ